MSGRYRHLYPWQILTTRFHVPLTCRLDRAYDGDELRKECEAILSTFRLRGQHGDDHAGGWRAIGLIAPDGDPYEDRQLDERPHLKTPVLAMSPYLQRVIDGFGCETRRVRLMQLLPGERVLWHFDSSESIDRANARVHVPIVTNAGVRFQISHEDCRWRPGELWYGDFSFPHRLHNTGSEGRIHLVLDLKVTDVVRSLFPREFLDSVKQRARLRGLVQAMVGLYTLPRYRIGYMKTRQARFVRERTDLEASRPGTAGETDRA